MTSLLLLCGISSTRGAIRGDRESFGAMDNVDLMMIGDVRPSRLNIIVRVFAPCMQVK